MKKLNNKGFSLVELIIVIAIMAILVGVVGTQVIPYLERSRNGVGRLAHTVCRITQKGREALHTYEQGLKNLFTEEVPAKEAHSLNV